MFTPNTYSYISVKLEKQLKPLYAIFELALDCQL